MFRILILVFTFVLWLSEVAQADGNGRYCEGFAHIMGIQTFENWYGKPHQTLGDLMMTDIHFIEYLDPNRSIEVYSFTIWDGKYPAEVSQHYRVVVRKNSHSCVLLEVSDF